MTILYKSSLFQTYGYYIIYPILMGISIFFIYGIISFGDFSFFYTIIFFILFYVFVSATESFIKLRYIEVTENNILIKTITKNKIVEFKNIAYVYDLINIKGNHLVLWYMDTEEQKLKVILMKPEMEKISFKREFPFYEKKEELNITKFIKEKAKKENPDYLNTNNTRYFLFSISPTF